MLLLGLQSVVANSSQALSPVAAAGSPDIDIHESNGGESDITESRRMSVELEPTIITALTDEPLHRETYDSHVYITRYGTFVFRKSDPTVGRVLGENGIILVRSISFRIVGENVRKTGVDLVLSANQTLYVAQFGIIVGKGSPANVVVSYEFIRCSSPKISARVESDRVLLDQDIRLEWEVVPELITLRLANRDYNIGEHGSLGFSSSLKRLEFFGARDSSFEDEWVQLDWNSTAAEKTRIEMLRSGEHQGLKAVIVSFPQGDLDVDPTVVGSSSYTYSTAYQNQRKTFFYDNYYWAFFHDGADIVYSVSHGGLTWEDPVPLGIGITLMGFDVLHAGGRIGLAWFDEYNRLKIREGRIVGNSIWWDESDDFALYPHGLFAPPSLTRGSDGTYYIGWIDGNTGGGPYLYVWRWKPEVSSLNSYYARELPDAQVDSTIQLFAHGPSELGILWSIPSQNVINWLSIKKGEDPPLGPHSFGPVWSGTPQHSLISAVSDSDGVVHVVYPSPSYDLKYRAIIDGTASSEESVHEHWDGVYSMFPTISIDQSDMLHVFWVAANHNAGSYRLILNYSMGYTTTYQHLGPNWFDHFEVLELQWYHPNIWPSSSLVASNYAFLLYTPQTTPEVLFLSFPVLANTGASVDRPWEGNGLPLQSDSVEQRVEFVSPATGSLAVLESDMFIPGREDFGLALERLYVSPRAVVKGATDQTFRSRMMHEFPYASFGQGWSLNLPWVDKANEILHLPGGGMYVIHFDEDFVFENHQGDHFTLVWNSWNVRFELKLKSGDIFWLDGWDGRPTRLTNERGTESLVFVYVPGDYFIIRDSLDWTRGIRLSLNQDNLVMSTFMHTGSSFPAEYKYVQYIYELGGIQQDGILRNVVTEAHKIGAPAAHESTWYDYDRTLIPGVPLLDEIVIPTGGKTVYTWEVRQASTESVIPVVTKQGTYDLGLYVKEREFFDHTVGGRRLRTEIVNRDPTLLVGTQVFDFPSRDPSVISTLFDENGDQMRLTVNTYDAGGDMVNQIVYPGDSVDQAIHSQFAYDEWGNMIYARDALGSEIFSSYAGTDYQNSFIGGGSLARVQSGEVFFDNFVNRSSFATSKWIGGPSLSHDEDVFLFEPPSMRLQDSWAKRYLTPFTPDGEVISFIVSTEGEPVGEAYVMLSDWSALTVRVILKFLDGELKWSQDGQWHTLMSYKEREWYDITLKPMFADDRHFLWIWVNGKWMGEIGYCYYGEIDHIRFGASGGPERVLWVERVKIEASNVISLNYDDPPDFDTHLQFDLVTYREELFDALPSIALTLGLRTVPVSWDSGTGVHHESSPYSIISSPKRLRVYRDMGTIEYSSPLIEFFGGDVWEFVGRFDNYEPRRIQEGNDESWPRHFDDDFFFSCRDDGRDGWNWVSMLEDRETSLPPSTPAVPTSWSLTHTFDEVHLSPPLIGHHWHGTRDLLEGQNPCGMSLTPTSEEYHVQYVYLQTANIPDELMLQYETSEGWNHRAYWGENHIDLSPKADMGRLPAVGGRWFQFLAKASDIDTVDREIIDLRFSLFNGEAYWGPTALLGTDYGGIEVTDLAEGMKVVLEIPELDLMLSETISISGSAFFDLYDWDIRVFPVTGFMSIYDDADPGPGEDWVLVHVTPRIEMWGGDILEWTGTDFFPNGVVDEMDLLSGALRFQNSDGRFSETPMRVMSYYSYSQYGEILETKVWCGDKAEWIQDCVDGWVREYYEYDEATTNVGHLTQQTDGNGHSTTFTYDADGIYLRSATDVESGQVVMHFYDKYTGLPEAHRPPESQDEAGETKYIWDGLGRFHKLEHPEIEGTRADITAWYEIRGPGGNGLDHDTITIENENNYKTREHLDGFGRTYRIERLDPLYDVYSYEEYEFNFFGKIAKSRILHDPKTADPNDDIIFEFSYEYDSSGRLVKSTNPDSTFSTIAYDDNKLEMTTTDEEGSDDGIVKEYSYDKGLRLISVRELDGASSFITSYEYDSVGNLIEIADSKGSPEVTQFIYDGRNLLNQTVHSDGSMLTRGYDKNGLPIWLQKPDGNKIRYIRDSLGRVTDEILRGSNRYSTFEYNQNGNLVHTCMYTFEKQVTTENVYDARDRLTDKALTLEKSGFGQVTETVHYDYDDAGNVESMSYGPVSLTYEYDDYGRLALVIDASLGELASFEYWEDDLPKQVTQGEGPSGPVLQTLYQYTESNGRLKRILATETEFGTPLLDMEYAHFGNGNIHTINNAMIGLETYDYDGLGRLRAAESANTWGTYSYSYDGVGNIDEIDVDKGGTPYQIDYVYLQNDKDQLHQVVDPADGTTTYDYDANGNMVHRENGIFHWEYVFDYRDELETVHAYVQIDPEQYASNYMVWFAYDAAGRMVYEEATFADPPCSTLFVHSGSEVVLEVPFDCATPPDPTAHVYANGLHIASVTSSDIEFHVQDHIGSVRAVVDDQGSVLWTLDYEPFGLEIGPPSERRFKYIDGQEIPPSGSDPVWNLDLYCLGSRFYDPKIGRFISRDPSPGLLRLPQTMNPYAYSANNPVTYSDPEGDLPFLLIIAAAMIVGLAVTASFSEGFANIVDPIMMAVGFIPILGDFISDPYFAIRSSIDCALGKCDALTLGIDIVVLLPFVSSHLRAVKRASDVADGITDAGRAANRIEPALEGIAIHKRLQAGYRRAFERMGLREGVDFFIERGVRHADDPMKVVGKGRTDIFLRLIDKETGKSLGLVMEIKSQLTRPGRYTAQIADYFATLRKAGYDSYDVLIHYY
ncbi:MAG: RHS repeat-associated core domain-containing protein [Thermoplasmata archaeon]|nr:RHS repeat-associated core domain-containing protein [Thermoplasmata archaeon]